MAALEREEIVQDLNKRLLVICHSYTDVQKDVPDGLASYFGKVDVLVRSNPLAEIARFIPLNGVKRYTKSNRIEATSPPNVSVTSTPVYYLPTERSYKTLGEKHFLAVRRAISDEKKYDIIHGQFLWSSGYVGARIKEMTGTPLIITGHGYDVYSLPFKDLEWKKRIQYVLGSADHIITVSQRNLQCIRELNASTPVTVIPNGFSQDMFYPRDKLECRRILGLPTDRKIILNVGNLEPVKGQEFLVRAISGMNRLKDSCLCVIIGSGSLHKALVQQIRELNCENSVMLAGGRPHDEIPLWMGASDVVVLSSLDEGNPLVMFEALGSGRPFIGTDVGGIPEIICSEEYGSVVKARDETALSQALMDGISGEWDPTVINDYSKNFTWERLVERIAKIFQSYS